MTAFFPDLKYRSDIKIGTLEKKLGLPKGAIRNPDGSDARSDKRLGELREEYARMYAGPPVRMSASQQADADRLKKAVAARKAKANRRGSAAKPVKKVITPTATHPS